MLYIKLQELKIICTIKKDVATKAKEMLMGITIILLYWQNLKCVKCLF